MSIAALEVRAATMNSRVEDQADFVVVAPFCTFLWPLIRTQMGRYPFANSVVLAYARGVEVSPRKTTTSPTSSTRLSLYVLSATGKRTGTESRPSIRRIRRGYCFVSSSARRGVERAFGFLAPVAKAVLEKALQKPEGGH